MSELFNYFTEIDVYLKESKSKLVHQTLEEYSVMVDVFNIPIEEKLQTENHQKIRQSVASKIDFFKNEITSLNKKRKQSSSAESTNSEQAQFNVLELHDIKSIDFDKESQKVIIENSEITKDYQFLIVENHELLPDSSELICGLFKKKPASSHRFVDFTFNTINPVAAVRKFIFFADKDSSSVVDNLFVGQLDEAGLLHVYTWIPKIQAVDQKFIQFYAQRIKDVIQKNYDYIQVNEFLFAKENSVSGFFNQVGVVKNSKLSLAIPSFSFWSKNDIFNYFVGVIENRLKKIHKINEKINRARSLS